MKSASKTVVISNALNRAAHRLTLSEKRLVMLAASELNHKGGNPAIELSGSALMEQYQLDSCNAYRELKKVCKSIMRKPPISIKMDGFLREINWAESCDYYDKEGRIKIQFTSKLAPHLSSLEGHFTKYKLSRTTGFRSAYSWKLFELVMQFKRTGLLRMNIDEFADAMEAPASHRKDFGAMRRRVIDAAIKEIKEKDGLDISYTVTKTGRKVTGLEFTFRPEQQKALPLQPPKKTGKSMIDRAYIEQHARPGETYETARIRLESEKRRDKRAA